MSEEFEPFADPGEKSVLIVDDDEGMRGFLETAVRKEGFQVATAADGKELQGCLDKALPDIILLDLMLPGEGGYEILKRLQEGETLPIPVVVITGRSPDRGVAERLVRQEPNVKEFMTKPLKVKVLAMTLHRLLRTKPRAPEV